MTTSQQENQTGTQDAPAPAGPGATAYAGLHESDVQDLYGAMHRLMDRHLGALRRLQNDAEGRVRLAVVEQQQLELFLDELSYRVRFLGEMPDADRDANVQRRAETQAQEQALEGRQAELRRAQARLEHLVSRLGWLIRQTTLSAQRGDDSAAPGDDDPWALLLRAQLIQGQEAERSRLAREIHDGPAQALTNTLLRLQFLETLIQDRPDEALQELALVRTSVRDSLRDVRRFIFNLRPASLKDIGLVSTLQRLINEYRDYTGLDVQAVLPETMELTPEQELVVFRVVQEALHNIQKHAVASRATVEVARRPGAWLITVEDDGRGFEPLALPGRPQIGSGLVSMRERAAIAGGSLEVSSGPGRGTRLVLTIPVPEAGPVPSDAAPLAQTQEVSS